MYMEYDCSVWKFEINLIMKYSKEKYILNNLINPNKNPMTNSNIPHHTF